MGRGKRVPSGSCLVPCKALYTKHKAQGTRHIIGLLGGSFNPAHAGHVHISRESRKRLGLGEVWWLVAPQNPLKSTAGMAPYAARLEGAKALAAGEKYIHVSDIEQRLGTRYTVETLRALRRKFPRARFVWVMGADGWREFHRWKKWQEIANIISILVVDRAPYSHAATRSKAALRLKKRRVSPLLLARAAAPAWAFLPLRRHPLSATALREKRAFPQGKTAL